MWYLKRISNYITDFSDKPLIKELYNSWTLKTSLFP